MAPTLGVVKVFNRHPAHMDGTAHVIKFSYGGQPYAIPNDGQPRALPVEAVKMIAGDWDQVDSKNDDARERERQRLNIQYGLFNAPFYSREPAQTIGIPDASEQIDDYVPVPDDHVARLVDTHREFIHPNLPHVDVFGWDDTRIFTMVDDPDGDYIGGTSRLQQSMDSGSEKLMVKTINELQAQIADLVKTVAAINPVKGAEMATVHNIDRADLPAVTPLHTPVDAGIDAIDSIAAVDVVAAMDVMNDELGYNDVDDTEPSDDPPAPARKAPARKAPSHKPPKAE